MGGYVAVDYKNSNNDNATLWWTNKEPRYNMNFWDIVDEWIVIDLKFSLKVLLQSFYINKNPNLVGRVYTTLNRFSNSLYVENEVRA